MNELAFPIVGSALVLVVVLPLSAIGAKLLLRALERAFGAMHALELRYSILVGSSVAPLAWLLSAGVHQAETGRGVVACLAHPAEGVCTEPALFAILLGAIAASLAVLRVARAMIPRARKSIADARAARVLALLERHASLGALRGRVVVRPDLAQPIATCGLWRSQVYVRSDLVDALDDEALAAALGHEASHVLAGDAARYFLLELALALNPFGQAILRPEVARWIHARETHCDREAVLGGASPAALAHALVVAARPASRPEPALGPGNLRALEQRVQFLMAYAEERPARCCESSLSLASVFVLAMLVVLPHAAGTHALDVLHAGSELWLVALPE